ncbi:MAG: hypothetical protein Q7R52_02355 [archaeon]|nr:hypothetical protein [archaeon]
MNSYPTGISGCFEGTGMEKDYTPVKRVGTNPDRFTEFERYNPMKAVYWGMAGIAGLTALVAGTIFTIKHFKK